MIVKGNRIIGSFLGNDFSAYTDEGWYSECRFHTSWDWLMPVIKKCHDSPPPSSLGWSKSERIESRIVASDFYCDDIVGAWLGVVEFIKWYNIEKGKSEKRLLDFDELNPSENIFKRKDRVYTIRNGIEKIGHVWRLTEKSVSVRYMDGSFMVFYFNPSHHTQSSIRHIRHCP